MPRKTFWFGLVVSAFAACTSLQYREDTGFLVSAQADSPEFPVYANTHLCTDMEGYAGLCSKRLPSGQDLALTFDPQQYDYLVNIRCSGGIEPSSISVAKGFSGKVTIPASEFSSLREFICEGYVQPQDRPVPTSAMFSIHVVVYDSAYTARERPYLTKMGGKPAIVLGEFARTSWVYDQGKWTAHSQETIVPVLGDPLKAKAYSESYAERFNYWNMGDADGGIEPAR